MKLDLQEFQTHLLKKGFNAKAAKPTRRQESRARLQRDLYRGRPRNTLAAVSVANAFKDENDQLYERLTNGSIRLARVDTPKTRRRAASELRRAGIPKKLAALATNISSTTAIDISE